MPGQLENCRICGGDELEQFLDLGRMPPVDSFLTEEQLGDESSYPLEVVACMDCGHVQLGYVAPREELFHEEYAYDMSVTDAGVEHFHTMAEELDRRYPGMESVLDIGSNTGVLLEGFQKRGWRVMGVEPSGNVYQRAVEKGIPTRNVFFSEAAAEKIREDEGSFDLVTATNVLAHIEDLHDAVKGVKTLLSEQGVFVFEVPYLVDLLENNEFDTIYHEHLSYFSMKPLKRLFDRHGMEVLDVEKQDIHGGSLRVYVARKGERSPTGEADSYISREEEEKDIHSMSTLEAFADRVEEIRDELTGLIEGLRSDGKEVVGVGAPAKGVVMLNYCGLDSEIMPYVTEKSDIKKGKYVPGTHNRVVPDERLLEDEPDYALLLPWNFADSIIDSLERYVDEGGKFIVPVPEPRIVEP